MERPGLRHLGRTGAQVPIASGEIVRAARSGAAIETLVELAAHGLLAASLADRAGVWLSRAEAIGARRQRLWEGRVIDVEAAEVPAEWNRLDPSVPHLKLVLEGQNPVVPGRGEVSGATAIPALRGFEGVLWLPLRARGRTVGLAMVASKAGQVAGDWGPLEALASELALAVTEWWEEGLGRLQSNSPLLQHERDLGRLEAELGAVLDSVDAGVLVLDEFNRIRFANQRLGQLFGLEAKQVVELDSYEALVRHIDDRLRDRETLLRGSRRLLPHGAEIVREELELIRPEHKVLDWAVRAILDRSGRPIGRIELFHDRGDQKPLRSDLLQTEKMAAIGHLVSGIAHELNNPLTGILGYAQLLLGRRLAPAQLGDAQRIYREAERARHIVKNLLLFARETKPERTAVDLNEIVERTLALRSYELKVEDIALELELDPNLPQTVGDPTQLQQVVLNLVVNSEQAILQSRGHGRIRICTRQAPGSRLVLEISDDGPGILPEVASRVFEPFFTTKPPGVGTGLGLSIVYGIVQEHGGDIYLESEVGRGSTFVVELPLVDVSAAQPSPRQAEPMQPAVRGRRILAVEDEPTVGQLIADVLSEEGHHVDVVLDSQEALNRVARTGYDLVICDLRMPRLDGQAFHRALVASGSPLQDFLILITGDTLAPRTLEFLEKSGLPYLAKPFLVEELKIAVARLLEGEHPDPRRPRNHGNRAPNAEAARNQ
jgi:signal transduction histidine kinase/FixJ family two-component response regulator